MNIDPNEYYMKLAFDEALKGVGHVNPNPMVGAILVKNGKIIGRGYHQKYGSAHAEVNAILDAKKNGQDVFGSDLYVNLEPCSHTKKQTPPCAPLLIEQKIKKVFISNIDPNPMVSGNGVLLLRQYGIEVEVGLLEYEGRLLNEVFFKAMNFKKPFVHLKMAQTLDGKVALLNGESKYITGPESLQYVHELRQKYDVIVIGKKTLLKDNPKLTVRLNSRNSSHPLRAIFCDLRSIDFELNVFSDEFKRNSMIVTTEVDVISNKEIALKCESLGIALLALPENKEGHVGVSAFLRTMYSLKMYSILVEGGPTLAAAFLKENAVDKVSIMIAPFILGDGVSTIGSLGIFNLKNMIELTNHTITQYGKDFMLEGYLCSQV
jgi:diaminohydroxyphosphoribosylaminopyrimidine deaminase/5-amino-6-(5-phosphoribosylamino)uracil reductase